MPWNNQDGDGGGRGPWGQGPRGGGNQTPDLEDLLKRGQDRFKRAFPGGRGGGFGSGGFLLLAILLLGLWISTGVRIVQPNEVGVVTRFGAFTGVRKEGFHVILPWPIDVMQKVSIKEETLQVGQDTSRNDGRRGREEEVAQNDTFMLTGDENIIGVRFSVRYRVTDPRAYLFNVENQIATLRAVADSAMREVVGQNNLEPIRNLSLPLDQTVRNLIQERLDEYKLGITITGIELEEPVLPPEVIPFFEDVQSAKQDLEKQRNQAEAKATGMRNRARGQVDQILNAAQAYERSKVAEAEGQAERFLAIYREYAKAKDVTRRRIFLETMENVFKNMDKVVIDKQSGGVVPYLPLPELHTPSRRSNAASSSNGSKEGGE